MPPVIGNAWPLAHARLPAVAVKGRPSVGHAHAGHVRAGPRPACAVRMPISGSRILNCAITFPLLMPILLRCPDELTLVQIAFRTYPSDCVGVTGEAETLSRQLIAWHSTCSSVQRTCAFSGS